MSKHFKMKKMSEREFLLNSLDFSIKEKTTSLNEKKGKRRVMEVEKGLRKDKI